MPFLAKPQRACQRSLCAAVSRGSSELPNEGMKQLSAENEDARRRLTMGSILNESDRTEIISRLNSLSTSSSRQWGSMDVAGMVQHLRLSAQMTLGELPVPSKAKRAFQVFPLKHLILYVLPFPKGAPTAPELKPVDAASLE